MKIIRHLSRRQRLMILCDRVSKRLKANARDRKYQHHLYDRFNALTAALVATTAHCSLLTAHCSLITDHCSLITAH